MLEHPDWTDASAYPSPSTASNARFAWEFLRRNSGYRATWAKYIRTLREGTSDDAEAAAMVDYLDATPEASRAMTAELYSTHERWNAAWARLEEKPCMWVRSIDGSRIRVSRLSQVLAQPWGLEDLASPLHPYDYALVRFAKSKRTVQPSSHSLKRLEDEHAEQHKGSVPPSFFALHSKWLVLQIDLEMPAEVTEQLVIERIQSARRTRARGGHIKPIESRARDLGKLVEGLRLLDAKAADPEAEWTHIGDVLRPTDSNEPPDYPRNARLKAAYKAACELRDGGYRVLPMLKEKNLGRRKKK